MGSARTDGGDSANVGFPIHCVYHGGNAALGSHGRHLWIADGRIVQAETCSG
jgi:hypothetical protein